MGVGVVFPGQGSQTPDMGGLVARIRPDLLAGVIELVGEDPFPRVAEAGRFAQPAIFCASLAWWDDVGGVEACGMAGHSLGEFAALVCAGALDAHEALALVVERGRLTDACAADGVPGGMLAVLGRDAAGAAASLMTDFGLSLANDNGPQQAVLSGPRDRVHAAAREAERRRVSAAVLPVPGAMHSEALRPAVGPFAEALARATFREPEVPVVSCTTGRPFADPAAELAETLVTPVAWPAAVATLQALGAERFVELGPGRVLRGLLRRIAPGVPVMCGEDLLASGI